MHSIGGALGVGRAGRVRRRGGVLAALATLVAVGVSGEELSDPVRFGQFADSIMSAHLAVHHVPGAVLVIVRDGTVFHARGYGMANLERGAPVDPEHTIFRVASVSKLVTATAAMQLVEQGRLALDRDVNTVLTRFKIPATYRAPVTLFHLLTHTAGFDERLIDRKSYRRPSELLAGYLERRMPPRIMPPGEFICYSNHGMALAGLLVELASGEPFEQYVASHVFRPLGMERSSFAFIPEPEADLAVGYRYGRGKFRPVRHDYIRTTPASMLSMSGADAARFMLAHLQRGRLGSQRILGDSTARLMDTRQFTQDPSLPGIAFGFWERFDGGERALWHDGDREGFSSLLYLLPDRGIGLFAAYNSRGGGPARRELIRAFHERFGAAPVDSGPVAGASTAAASSTPATGGPELRRFAGTYLYNRYGHRGLDKIATLGRAMTVSIGPGGTLVFDGESFTRTGPLRFRSRDGAGGVAFRVDRSGAVTHLFAGRSIARVYERLPWYATDPAQIAALLVMLIGFLMAIVVWPLATLIRRLARPPRASRIDGRTRLVATAVALLDLGFLVGFAVLLATSGEAIEYGMPRALEVVLIVPLVTTVLRAVLAWRCAAVWLRGQGSIGERLQLGWITLAALGFVPLLLHWNLLGIHT